MTALLTFARERLDPELLAELEPLLSAHWQEIAHYPDIPLAVDREAYLNAELRGDFRLYTVRHSPDLYRIVGYAAYFVRHNPHYAGSLQAVQDVLYVDPNFRGSAGARLIRFADDALRAEGVQVVYQHVKLAHNFGPLLERLGYEAVETIYAKRLDREERR